MEDYKTMYTKLFNKVTAIIEDLQEVQRQTEQMYIESSKPEIALFKREKVVIGSVKKD